MRKIEFIAYADHLKRALLSRNSSVMTKLLSFSNMRNRSMKNEFWPACYYVLLYLRDSSCNLFPKGNIVELHVLSLCKSLLHPFLLECNIIISVYFFNTIKLIAMMIIKRAQYNISFHWWKWNLWNVGKDKLNIL